MAYFFVEGVAERSVTWLTAVRLSRLPPVSSENAVSMSRVLSPREPVAECQEVGASRYCRVLRRRGHKKAIAAVAHSLLVTVYHVLAHGTTYQKLGGDYYDSRHTERVTRRAVQTLEQQSYRVTLERAA